MDHVTACSVHLSTLKRKNGPCQSCFPDSIETEKKQAKAANIAKAKAAEETTKTPDSAPVRKDDREKPIAKF